MVVLNCAATGMADVKRVNQLFLEQMRRVIQGRHFLPLHLRGVQPDPVPAPEFLAGWCNTGRVPGYWYR